MTQPIIAFFDTKSYDRESFEEVNQQFGFDLRFFKGHLSEQNVVFAEGASALCLFVNDVVDARIAEILKDFKIKLIALRCAGFNNIDFKALGDDVKVARVPAYSPHAVAEHAMGMILSLNRKIHRAYYRTRDHNFSIEGFLGFDLLNKTIGVVGTGKIGQTFIEVLRGFGVKVLAYDPFPNIELEKTYPYMRYVDLAELYENSDIISLHCPLTPDTHHMINEQSISQMKEGVMLINTSRGLLIETKALIVGLKLKKIALAGLDVYEEESDYFFEDHSSNLLKDDVLARLLTFHNVLITSHQAFFTQEALRNIAETTLHNIDDYVNQRTLINQVKGS